MKPTSVVAHYDLLISENNDPMRDPAPLREYMNQYDGQIFIDKMELSPRMSVLEIGIGTGRLASRVAPRCRELVGIDLSPKTIERAKENCSELDNLSLICGDFLDYRFSQSFDVIYSSLTFMHIKEKRRAIHKVATLLRDKGKLVLSIDKNQNRILDMGTRTLLLFPDTPNEVRENLADSGLRLLEEIETELAYLFVADKVRSQG